MLPIVFARGQNESIDPRLAPTDVHAVAQNVRWRKDGRPAKRYGSVAITTTGLDASLGYTSLPANAVAGWNGDPLFVLGSGVRQFIGGNWTGVAAPGFGELSHWGPGERDIVARNETAALSNMSSGACKGVTFHAWDDGSNIFYSYKASDGTTIRPPTQLATGTYPRVISTTNFLYILWKNGTTLNLTVFDPTALTLNGLTSPGTLSAAAAILDGCGRGSDFLIAYQSAAGTVTVKLLTAIAVPVVTQTQTRVVTTAVTPILIGVVGDATNNVFLGTSDGGGNIQTASWNNALSASTGTTTVETDPANFVQPGLVLEAGGVAQITWGGFTGAGVAYMRAARISVGSVLVGPVTYFGVNPASKPFMGPAFAAASSVDSAYVWVEDSHNSNSKWFDQRTYVLVRFALGVTSLLQRQLHTPNVISGSFATQTHLSDVVNLGVGYGYLTPIPNQYRGGSTSSARGFDTVTIRSIFESPRMAARDFVTAGRVTQFSGGSLFEFDGFANETGFTNFPVIQSITGGAGGALTAASNYLYRAVYEYIDLQGRRHRSAASDPLLFASGANSSATLVMKPLVANNRFPNGSVTLHVYRTLAGQSSFHRVTPDIGAPSGAPSAATVSYTDLMADSVASANEFIYTDGGVVDNTLPPPSTFMCVCNGRVWLGGQLDRTVITSSKILVDGEPTQFSDEAEFSVTLPEKCTALASIDGTVVAFARERIYFVTGDGPNDQGIGSFNPPTELPTDVGCIDWRSIVETSQGIFFQSKRGIYLLPRGFNTPVFVGAAVEDTLLQFPIILSATLVVTPGGSAQLGEVTVRFVAASDETTSSSCVLVYDPRVDGWSVDSTAVTPFGVCGTWADSFIATKCASNGIFSSIWREAQNTYADEAKFIATRIKTGDIRPFGLAGYGQLKSVLIVGEYRGNATVNVNVITDGNFTTAVQFNVTSSDNADGSVYLDVTPQTQRCSSFAVDVNDGSVTVSPDTPTEGFIAQGLFLEFESIGGTARLAAARRA